MDILQIDASDWCKQIETFIYEKFSVSGRDGIVVPISGGLDSSVVLTLCTRAVGKQKVIGLMLPERLGNPEADYYGRLIAKHLDIQTIKINISPILRRLGTSNLFLSAISGRKRWNGFVTKFLQKRNQTSKSLFLNALKGNLDTQNRKLIASINSKQRARHLIAYKVADEKNFMLAGSSHKTEQTVGLFVKYGIDDCADIMPLKHIYRSQLLQLAEFIGVPPEIIRRSPNPDILPGITDKYLGYFSLDYQKIDLILMGLENKLDLNEIALQLDLNIQTVEEMCEIIRLSESFNSHALAPDLK